MLKREKFEKKKPSLWRRLNRRTREHKATFWLYLFLRIFVVVALIIALINGDWAAAFFCVLTLFLFLIPFFVEENFQIELPTTLEIIVLLFIFCSEILGEAAAFYVNIPLWDSVLHTVNGFLCAAIGFALIDILNRKKKRFNLSPLFLTVVAFSFSMTVGVMWEFFEFFMDTVLRVDMQKDFIIDTVRSVTLDESKQNIVITVENIAKTVLYDGNGQILAEIEGGFLDIGLIDTMKDLILNFIGAFAFSVIGYFYVLQRGRGKFAKQFIPTVAEEKKEENNLPPQPK